MAGTRPVIAGLKDGMKQLWQLSQLEESARQTRKINVVTGLAAVAISPGSTFVTATRLGGARRSSCSSYKSSSSGGGGQQQNLDATPPFSQQQQPGHNNPPASTIHQYLLPAATFTRRYRYRYRYHGN